MSDLPFQSQFSNFGCGLSDTYDISRANAANLLDFPVINLGDLVSRSLPAVDSSYRWNAVIENLRGADSQWLLLTMENDLGSSGHVDGHVDDVNVEKSNLMRREGTMYAQLYSRKEGAEKFDVATI